MIRIVLSIIVLHQEAGTLQAVIMWLSRLGRARPGKIDFFRPGLLDLLQIFIRNFTAISIDIFLEQFGQQATLGRVHFTLIQSGR